MSSRTFTEAQYTQGVDEVVAYGPVTTTSWGSNPTSPTLKVQEWVGNVWVDQSSTMTSGSCSVVGDVVSLPSIKSLVEGHAYKVILEFTIGASTLSADFVLSAEK